MSGAGSITDLSIWLQAMYNVDSMFWWHYLYSIPASKRFLAEAF